MDDTSNKLIEHWKRHSPRPNAQIPFGSIMKALTTEYSTVEFKEEAVGRWGVRCFLNMRQPVNKVL